MSAANDASPPVFPHFTHEHVFVSGGMPVINMEPPYQFINSSARSVEPEHSSVVSAIAEQLAELENEGVLLCQFGLLPHTDEGRREYEARKRNGHLFDVRAVQLALAEIPRVFAPLLTPELRAQGKRWRPPSNECELKVLLEFWRRRHVCRTRRDYIVAGDFALAMLLRGYPFKKVEMAGGDEHMEFRVVSIGVEIDEFGNILGVYDGVPAPSAPETTE